MLVTCGRCQTNYEFDERHARPGGAPVQCTRCGHVFSVAPRAEPPPLPSAATLLLTCQRCGTTYSLLARLVPRGGAPVQCTRCGLTFMARHQANPAPAAHPWPERRPGDDFRQRDGADTFFIGASPVAQDAPATSPLPAPDERPLAPLLKHKVLDEGRLARARKIAEERQCSMTEALLANWLVLEADLLRAFAEEAGCYFMQSDVLRTLTSQRPALAMVPAEVAQRLTCCPLLVEPGSGALRVLFAVPLDPVAVQQLEFATRVKVEPLLGTPAAVEALIRRSYSSDARAFTQVTINGAHAHTLRQAPGSPLRPVAARKPTPARRQRPDVEARPLREQPVPQTEGQGPRRWFTSDDLDLLLVLGARGEPLGFQLSFDKRTRAQAITFGARGFAHSVSPAPAQGLDYTPTPILLGNGKVDVARALALLEASAGHVPPKLAQFVSARLRAHPDYSGWDLAVKWRSPPRA